MSGAADPRDGAGEHGGTGERRDRAPVRVLVVDDDALVRTGLRLMLGGEPDLDVVGEAADGDEVSAAVAAHRPDVVLMDIRMPRVDGIAATRHLLATRLGDEPARGVDPRPAVVMLTTFDADATVLEALRAGAAGYLLKHAEPRALVAAVHRAAVGDPVFSPDVLHALVDHARSGGTPPARDTAFETLTPRERDIAGHVAQGRSNAEIAAALYLSAGTVKADISAILARLGLDNRIQLAIRAHEHGSHQDRSHQDRSHQDRTR